jgi:hypothetical protein
MLAARRGRRQALPTALKGKAARVS